MLAGMVTGALGSAVCNPFDLAKVLMSAEKTRGTYSNSIHALVSVAQEEGLFRGLWRASGVTMVRMDGQRDEMFTCTCAE